MPGDVERLTAMLDRISALPGFEDDQIAVDTSLDVNREISLRWFASVGIDDALAEALWSLDLEPEAWPVYADAADTVQSLRAFGVSTALVSDFHADLRPHLHAHGIDLDAYVISFEHGFQKPDPRMFLKALELLHVDPKDALMVGDRLTHDGGAAAIGIDTLLLPQPPASGTRGLDVVVRMLG